MNRLKFLTTLFLLFITCHCLNSQNSKQITLSHFDRPIDNKTDEDDNTAYWTGYYSPIIGFSIFDNTSIFDDSIQTTDILIDNFDFNVYNGSFFSQNQFFVSSYFVTTIDNIYEVHPTLFSYNFSSNESWLLENNKSLQIIGKAKPDGTVMVGTADFIPMSDTSYSGIHRLSSEGVVIWDKAFDLYDEQGERQNSEPSSIDFFSNGDFIMTGNSKESNYLAKFDADGNLKQAVFLEDCGHNKIIINSHDEVIVSFLYSETCIPSPFDNKFGIRKFDKDLNLIWSKRFFGEGAHFSRSNLNIFPNDTMILAYQVKGAFPIILAKIGLDGEIISQKGYPLQASDISTLSTGALVMTTGEHFDENGEIFPKSILTKTDANGDIDGCGTYLSCLQSEELPAIFANWSLQENDIPTTFAPFPYTLQSQMLPYEDFCEIPPPPTPEFSFPDTLCIGMCAETTDTYNHFAHSLEWQLTGNNTDSLLRDSLNFSYCFDQSGEYELIQTIWLLGCDYVFSKKIVVLSPLDVEINPTSTICEMPPIEIGVNSSRPLESWLWSDGTTQAQTQLFESDTVAVLVNDGYCMNTDTTVINFHNESIDEDSIMNFVEQQTVCQQNLPLNFLPQSAYTDSFSLHKNSFSIDSLTFTEAGIYPIYARIDNCIYQKEIEIMVNDCHFSAYFPNVFSPNQDGINDYFYPQGENITAIELLIFDRWGSLVFESQNDLPRWNGELKGKSVREGIYVWLFSYKNDLTGEILVQSGEVLVLR